MLARARDIGAELDRLTDPEFYAVVLTQLCSMAQSYDPYRELHTFVTGLAVRSRCDRGVVVATLALMLRIAGTTRKGLNANNVKRYWLAGFQLTHGLLADRTYNLAGWAELTGGEYGEKPIAFLQFSLLKVLQWDYSVSTEEYVQMASKLLCLYKHTGYFFTLPGEQPDVCVTDTPTVICDTPGATPPADYRGTVQVW